MRRMDGEGRDSVRPPASLSIYLDSGIRGMARLMFTSERVGIPESVGSEGTDRGDKKTGSRRLFAMVGGR